MKLYLAPMEGLTGVVVRNAFFHHFNYIDKYFTPFIPASEHLNKKTVRDILPENNAGMTLIPQLMSNKVSEVLYMAQVLSDYGYREINLNLGCPSGTVTSKKRGSGLLAYPDELDRFLDGLFEKADFPVSVKTRIGYASEEEWQTLLSIYQNYPVSELIIHPRLRSDFYKGTPRMEAFDLAAAGCAADTRAAGSMDALCYNGDIWRLSDYQALVSRYPGLTKVMVGRGLFARPSLSEQIKSFPTNDRSHSCRTLPASDSSIVRKRLYDFHNEIYDGYLAIFSGEKDVTMHMKEIWSYLGQSFENSEKYVKKILKSQSGAAYTAAVRTLFEECACSADAL